jgi:hypothetical protein
MRNLRAHNLILHARFLTLYIAMSTLWKRLWEFLSHLFNWDPVEAEKRAALKNIHRMLQAVSPPYFDARTGQVLPGFAKSIFALSSNLVRLEDILRKTVLNKDSRLSQLYNDFLIESSLPEDERLKKASFSRNEIKNRLSASLSPGIEGNKVNHEFSHYIRNFAPLFSQKVNESLRDFDRMIALCQYNFIGLLTHFDSRYKPEAKGLTPKFAPAGGETVFPELMDIYFILANFKVTDSIAESFTRLIERLRLKEDSEIKADVKKTLARIEKLCTKYLDPSVLLALMRAIKQDPGLIVPSDHEKTDHVRKYVTRITNQLRKDLDTALREISENAMMTEIKDLFGDDLLIMPEGYNEEEASILYSQGITSFTHVKPLVVLKNFFIYKFDERIKAAMTKLIVEGFFDDKGFQNDFSTTYYLCEKSQERIVDFERSLTGNSRTSISTIRMYLSSLRSGKNIGLQIDTIIEEINKKAVKLVEEETSHLNFLSLKIQDILDDFKNKSPVLVANIKVIGGNKNSEFIGALVDALRSINKLIRLMQNFIVIHHDIKHPLTDPTAQQRIEP